jgi:hypothetical protein
VLRDIGDSWQVEAVQQLDLLLEYGHIETRQQNRQLHLHIAAQWLPGLLDLTLGYPPAEWDPEVWHRINHLPEPLSGKISERSVST